MTYRAFGVPRGPLTEDIMRVAAMRSDDLAREVGLTIAPGGGQEALAREDGIDPAEHAPDFLRNQALLTTQFLIDRAGVIRWTSGEDPSKGPTGLGGFPSDEEILAAARAL